MTTSTVPLMSPCEYMEKIVVPTVQEFMADRGNQRRAYAACGVAFHLCDYLFRAEGTSLTQVRQAIRAPAPDAFDIVDGVCNGSKHCGRDKGAFRHQPGSEEVRAAFTVDHSFLDYDRLETEGLIVVHSGQAFYIDECLQTYLDAAMQAFPAHLGAASPGRFHRGEQAQSSTFTCP